MSKTKIKPSDGRLRLPANRSRCPLGSPDLAVLDRPPIGPNSPVTVHTGASLAGLSPARAVVSFLGAVSGSSRRRRSGLGIRIGLRVAGRVGVCLDADSYPDTPLHLTAQLSAADRRSRRVPTDPQSGVSAGGGDGYG